MDDVTRTGPFTVYMHGYPLWVLVNLKEYLENGLPEGLALIEVPFHGHCATAFSTEFDALRFQADAQDPNWGTILIRTPAELRSLASKLLGGYINVGFDYPFPGSNRPDRGFFVTPEEICDKLAGH